MAHAQRVFERVTEQVVALKEVDKLWGVVLNLNVPEAKILAYVLSKVGGTPSADFGKGPKFARGHCDAVLNALHEAGIDWHAVKGELGVPDHDTEGTIKLQANQISDEV